MATTSIEWTDAVWNPTTGCDKVSAGCDNCYALTMAKRLKAMGHAKYQTDGPTGTSGPGFGLTVHDDVLDLPLRWRKPRRVFVNSMSDLFHEKVPDEFIAEVFARMWWSPQHTFQILTKRHGRMRSLVPSIEADLRQREGDLALVDCPTPLTWPLPNAWLGVSVENQQWADIRIPALLDIPAAVRWISAEPLLGPVDLTDLDSAPGQAADAISSCECDLDFGACICPPRLDWVVCGGESGKCARPMDPAWARSLRNQCQAASVPFFFKQWGEWAPNGYRGIGAIGYVSKGRERLIGDPVDDLGHRVIVERMGKHRAGRLLDGRTWDEYPGGG